MSTARGGGTAPAAQPEQEGASGPRRPRLTPAVVVVGAVVLVVAAIAVPQAFGGGPNAADSSAQSDLANALASLKTLYTDGGAFPSVMAISDITEAEPELTVTYFLVSSAGSPHSVSFLVSPDGEIVIVADESTDQRCWYAEDNEETDPGQTGGLPANRVSTIQGLSYNGTPQGTKVTLGCGFTDAYLITAVGWGPTYPS
jgi:type II secretory pathway pseudopilin PulG